MRCPHEKKSGKHIFIFSLLTTHLYYSVLEAQSLGITGFAPLLTCMTSESSVNGAPRCAGTLPELVIYFTAE